jgi:hypothetical protein
MEEKRKRPLNVSHESIERTHTQAFAEERADWRAGRRSFPEKSGTNFHAKVGTKIEANTSIYYCHNQSVQYGFSTQKSRRNLHGNRGIRIAWKSRQSYIIY